MYGYVDEMRTGTPAPDSSPVSFHLSSTIYAILLQLDSEAKKYICLFFIRARHISYFPQLIKSTTVSTSTRSSS